MARFVLPVVLFAALVGGYVVGQQPRTQADNASRRCIGITSSILRQSPTITRVYRAFDDGAVESFDDGNPQAKWTPIGQ